MRSRTTIVCSPGCRAIIGGYSPLGFFSPANRYFGPGKLAGHRDMIRAFRDAGIDVILDIVRNQRAESNEMGATLARLDQRRQCRKHAQHVPSARPAVGAVFTSPRGRRG